MCLVKKSWIPRIALKDITVYKVLIIGPNNTYTTYFMGNKIIIGETYKGVFKKYNRYDSPKSTTLIKSLFSEEIGIGYIHSYKSYYTCKERITFYSLTTITKCVIPKYTLYFIGKYGDIASRKLKYLEIVE